MSFIRPELRRTLWLWREPLMGGALALLGLLWLLTERGLMVWVGGAVAAVGAIVAFTGVQRLRFRTGAGGPGVLHIDERQVTYFGPETGGAISIDALSRIDLVPGRTHSHWRLMDSGGTVLDIPTHAEGADGLFDVFAALDGIRTEAMLAHLRHPPSRPVTIWTDPRLAQVRRLH